MGERAAPATTSYKCGEMRRILMIYDRFPPFNTSGSARPFRFAKHLPEFGYLPTVISLQPDDAAAEDASILGELDARVEILRAAPAIRPTLNPIVRKLAERKRPRSTSSAAFDAASRAKDAERAEDARTVSSEPVGAKAWQRQASGFVLWSLDWYLDWGWPCLRLARKAASRERYDLVWASAPHSKNAFAGYLVSRALGLPLVLDQRDPWTYGSNWRPRLASTGRVETWWAHRIIEHAAWVVFTSPLTEKEMQARFPRGKMATITNGFDEREVTPLRDVHPDKCLFRYTGVLNDRRVPDVLLEGLKLAAEDPEFRREVRLEFVGGMAGHEAKIERYGLDGLVDYRGHVAKVEAERLIRGSDVNVLLQTITTGQDVIAGKVYDYLAARKPILAVVSEQGGDAWLLKKTGLGIVVSFQDPPAVARAFRELWQRFRQGGRPVGPDVDLESFTSRSLTAELARLLDRVPSHSA